MSYILDALRRADAERQRGSVPGLHDLPPDSTLIDAAPAPATRSRRLGLAALALVGLGLAGGAGWLLRPVGLAASGPVAVPGAVAVVQPPLLTAAPSPAVVQAQPLPAPPGPTGRAPPTPIAAATSRRPSVPAASPPVPPMTEPALAADRRPAATQMAATAPPARLPTLAELPEAQRRELGPLVVGGAMHAEQAALRIVILNGQVVHEGDKLGPDLLVQQIRLKSVVMSHRGQRFELPF